MPNPNIRKYSELLTEVTNIVEYFVNLTISDTKFLDQVLDGGSVPEHEAKSLRPIIWKLITGDENGTVTLSDAEALQLECISLEVNYSIEQQRNLEMTIAQAISETKWRELEQVLAGTVGFSVIPNKPQSLRYFAIDIEKSDFKFDDIARVFSDKSDQLAKFWTYQQANKVDYGEEWDPLEGNQQDEPRQEKIIGMSQGFLINTAILYLYLSSKPMELQSYFKRMQYPQAEKVANELIRMSRHIFST